jgi:hypothetical protein
VTAPSAAGGISESLQARRGSLSSAQGPPCGSVGREAVKVAIILWSGLVGGAETWSLALAKAFTRRGVGCGLVVVGNEGPILAQARGSSIPTVRLGLPRGSQILSRPRQFAEAVASVSREVAILPSSGYLSAILRLGGFKGKIVAVEHGCLLQNPNLRWMHRLIRLIDRRAAFGQWMPRLPRLIS